MKHSNISNQTARGKNLPINDMALKLFTKAATEKIIIPFDTNDEASNFRFMLYNERTKLRKQNHWLRDLVDNLAFNIVNKGGVVTLNIEARGLTYENIIRRVMNEPELTSEEYLCKLQAISDEHELESYEGITETLEESSETETEIFISDSSKQNDALKAFMDSTTSTRKTP